MGRKYVVKLRDYIQGIFVEPYVKFKVKLKNKCYNNKVNSNKKDNA